MLVYLYPHSDLLSNTLGIPGSALERLQEYGDVEVFLDQNGPPQALVLAASIARRSD